MLNSCWLNELRLCRARC